MFSVQNFTDVALKNLKFAREVLPASVSLDIKGFDAKKALPVACDSADLFRIFSNLFSNAAQAMNYCGTITVRLEHTTRHILLTIRDTGPGIPDKLREKIFTPFFTTKDVGEGTGLGLSIIHGIIERWGGTIALADHQEDSGAVFHITLPLAVQAKAA